MVRLQGATCKAFYWFHALETVLLLHDGMCGAVTACMAMYGTPQLCALICLEELIFSRG